MVEEEELGKFTIMCYFYYMSFFGGGEEKRKYRSDEEGREDRDYVAEGFL